MIDLGELLCFGPLFFSRHTPHHQCLYPHSISKSVIVLYVLPEDPFLTLSVFDLCRMGFSGPCQQTFHCMHAKSLQLYLISSTPWTVACQAPPSMGFCRQEYWSELPFPPPRDLTQEWIPSLLCFLHCRWILYHLSPWGSLNNNNKSKYNYLQHGIMSPD